MKPKETITGVDTELGHALAPADPQKIIEKKKKEKGKKEFEEFEAFAYGRRSTKLSDDELRRELICIARGIRPSRKNIQAILDEENRLPDGIRIMVEVIRKDHELAKSAGIGGTLVWLLKKAVGTENEEQNSEEDDEESKKHKSINEDPYSLANTLGFPINVLIGYLQAIFGGITKGLNDPDAIAGLINENLENENRFFTTFYQLLGLDDTSGINEIKKRCKLFEERISRLKKLINLPDMEDLQQLGVNDSKGQLDEEMVIPIPDRRNTAIAKEFSIAEDIPEIIKMIEENEALWTTGSAAPSATTASGIDPLAPTALHTMSPVAAISPVIPARPVLTATPAPATLPATTTSTATRIISTSVSSGARDKTVVRDVVGPTRIIMKHAELDSGIDKLQALLDNFKTLTQPEASALRKRINNTAIAQGNDLGDKFIIGEYNDILSLVRAHFGLIHNTEMEAKLMEIIHQFTEAGIIA